MDCDVCGGSGRHPVINMYGIEVYSIDCPECLGSGEMHEAEPEPADWPPASTAAKMRTMDDLRAWMASQGRG